MAARCSSQQSAAGLGLVPLLIGPTQHDVIHDAGCGLRRLVTGRGVAFSCDGEVIDRERHPPLRSEPMAPRLSRKEGFVPRATPKGWAPSGRPRTLGVRCDGPA